MNFPVQCIHPGNLRKLKGTMTLKWLEGTPWKWGQCPGPSWELLDTRSPSSRRQEWHCPVRSPLIPLTSTFKSCLFFFICISFWIVCSFELQNHQVDTTSSSVCAPHRSLLLASCIRVGCACHSRRAKVDTLLFTEGHSLH